MPDRLPLLFVATAADRLARRRYANSLANPIAPDIVALLPEQLRRLGQNPDGQYFAWGATAGTRNAATFEAMQPGDVVLFVWGLRYRSKAKVLATGLAPEFARRLWGDPSDPNVHENVYLVSQPEPVDVPVPQLADYLPRLYFGLTPIAKSRLARIVDDYGSLDDFIATRLGSRPRAHLILTSNSTSPWDDADGEGYEYGSNVPNYKRVEPGARVLIQRIDDGQRLIMGHATIESIEERPGRGKAEKVFFAQYGSSYQPFVVPLPFSKTAREDLEALTNYNPQHAITFLPEGLFDAIIEELQGLGRALVVGEDALGADSDENATEQPQRREISRTPPRAPRANGRVPDPKARQQSLERRNTAHHRLVLSVLDRAERAGLCCDCTQYADALCNGAIFEMKSLRKDGRAQIRRAIGQLYDYLDLHSQWSEFEDADLYVVTDSDINPRLKRLLRRACIGLIILHEDGALTCEDDEIKDRHPWLFGK